MRNADRYVFIGTVFLFFVSMAFDHGFREGEQKAVKQCKEVQAGERLVSVTQHKDWTICTYAQGYGRAKVSRKAT